MKVVGALLARGLAREEVTDRTTRADSALNTVWRNEDDGRAVLLKITPEGLAAIGVEPAPTDEPEAAPAGEPVGEARPNRGAEGGAGRGRRRSAVARRRRLPSRPAASARPATTPSRRS